MKGKATQWLPGNEWPADFVTPFLERLGYVVIILAAMLVYKAMLKAVESFSAFVIYSNYKTDANLLQIEH